MTYSYYPVIDSTKTITKLKEGIDDIINELGGLSTSLDIVFSPVEKKSGNNVTISFGSQELPGGLIEEDSPKGELSHISYFISDVTRELIIFLTVDDSSFTDIESSIRQHTSNKMTNSLYVPMYQELGLDDSSHILHMTIAKYQCNKQIKATNLDFICDLQLQLSDLYDNLLENGYTIPTIVTSLQYDK